MADFHHLADFNHLLEILPDLKGRHQRDLFVVLTASTLGLALLFLIFLRSWRALFVFLVPVSVVGLAAVAVSWCYPSISGVTLGFGAVLLGIAVDYGLHVYFALRQGGRSRRLPWDGCPSRCCSAP